jgi:hypothetical protein
MKTETVYFHVLDCPAPILDAIRAGLTVWNAPRPLYGSELFGMDWSGPFRHGRFYSAVDPADPYAEIWERKNVELDAYPVGLITNEEIERRLRAHAEEAGYNIEEVLEDYTIAQMARDAGLPWAEEKPRC